MPKYKILYFFDGRGETLINAKNKKKAEEKWLNGDFSIEEDDKEWWENYYIETINKV